MVLLTLLLAVHSTTLAKPLPPSQAIGTYSKGKLKYAVALPAQGKGYIRLFLPRNRGWGTQALITTLIKLGIYTNKMFPEGERLQIGDCAAQHGGKITKHDSHQNGLDSDIVYLRHNHREQDPYFVEGFDEKFVENGVLSSNFDVERNWLLLKNVNQIAQVNRIFMDPVIKKTFCAYAAEKNILEENREFLRKLRPLEGHQDHFHLRLKCPVGNSRCQQQEAPAEGDGCSEVEASSP